MTAIAALVAEAIAKAEVETPEKTEGCHYDARAVRIWQGCVVLGTASLSGSTMPNYLRRDVVDAALAHLATRAAEAEGRAERAEAALIRVVEVGDGVGFDVAVKALREAGLMDPEDDDEEDTARG